MTLTLGEWMRDKQLVDQEVADAVGVTRPYFTRIRNGMVHPSLGTALRIWEYTDRKVDLYQLLPIHMRPSLLLEPPKLKRPRAEPDTLRKPAAPKASRARARA